ncbi:VOC family protein [Nonomuraea candida]|uniref:VOC family protein n=1 Tax=Nonomuraea candida TaxID=359159 RepID=UPI000A00BEC4|nr:VOC family protein [Nonomuraea candida]
MSIQHERGRAGETPAHPPAGETAGTGPEDGQVACPGPYHIGYVVPDIEAAMRDFTRAAGTAWNPVREGRLGGWDYRIVFSRHGPPYTELIEGPAGSPWEPGRGARCDHLGFWAAGIDECAGRLAARGWPLDFDARPYGRPFTYHRMTGTGVRLELVDVSVQPEFLRAWNPGGPPMTALRC